MVRRATSADAAALAPLVRALAVEEGYAHPPSIHDLTSLIATLIADRSSDFFLAISDMPVGCLQMNYRYSTWATARYGYLEDFYLVPSARSQGIGTAMMTAAYAHARAVGCVYVELDVRPENRDAQRLYERLGFQRGSNEVWRRKLSM